MLRRKNKQLDTAVDDQLAALVGEKKTKSRPRWLWACFGAGVLLLGGAGYYFLWYEAPGEVEVTYREYTVEQGDITVGSTESSSISLSRETVTFPVSSVVEEVYVKAGSYVDAGDPLMKLSWEQIETGLASYELELEQAGLDLEQAKLQQETGLLNAQQAYETSQQAGELAEINEALSVAELELSLQTAQLSLQSALSDYDEYLRQYQEDYFQLSSYSDALSSATSSRDTASSSLSSYQEQVSSYLAGLNTAYTDGATYNDYSQLEEAIAAVNAYYQEVQADPDYTDEEKDLISATLANLQSYSEQLSSLSDAASSAQAAYEAADATYEAFADTYENTYGTLGYETDYYANLANLQNQIDRAALSLAQTEVSKETDTTAAQQQSESSETEASIAGAELELTEMQLQQQVDAAQAAYDALETEIEEIKDSIGDDGMIYAPCSGMVSSVLLEVGDSFEVYYDQDTESVVPQSLAIITDISDIYVPITISEEDILDVSIGQDASVTMTAFEGQTFEAEVDSISVESSRSGAATVSYTVNVRYKGTNTQQMFEGMSAEVTLIQWQVQDVLYVNTQCVTNVNGRATVLVRGEDGQPVEREVTTGFSDGRYVEITSGLSLGETVLVESAVQQ